jgi:alpha-glucosidase
MVWDKGAPNGGFSTAKPWLPVPPEHVAMAVNVQKGDPNSLLEHYRRFLAFRRAHPALAKGEIEFLAADGDTVAFVRRQGNEQIACAFNLGSKPATIGLGSANKPAPLDGHGFSGTAGAGAIQLGAYGAWFGRLA